ncbi:MAG: isochorismate synthase [Solirubrobacterales bacterium]
MTVEAAAATLLEHFDTALANAARRPRPTLATASVRVDGAALDPAAEAVGGRLADDRWFCWEQPDEGFALAGLGEAHAVVTRGPDRASDLIGETAELMASRCSSGDEELEPGAGPVWVGGMSFAPDGAASGPWSSFAPARMACPELALACRDGHTTVTAAALVRDEADIAAGRRALEGRLARLGDHRLPMRDPWPTGRCSVSSARAPGDFEDAVSQAAAAIRAGRLDKVVLAREVRVQAPTAYDAGALFGALRESFPSCFCFAVGTPEAAFCGASPELLVRRRGQGASTVALAGSTRRSADPALDDHLGEQLLRSAKDRREHEVVVERIQRTLRPWSVWVQAEPDPVVIQVANIQHLATPIHALLSQAHGAVELAARLHPTPAVGGEPWDLARELLAPLEQMDRGWYAGPVGWMDAAEDGDFCVALRSALLRDRTAHLFAGVGVVGASDPTAELAETELKLQALLPLVTG